MISKSTAEDGSQAPEFYEAMYYTQDALVRTTPGSDFFYRRYRPAMDVLHRTAVEMARKAAEVQDQDDIDPQVVEAVKRGLRTGYVIGEMAVREGRVTRLGHAWVDFNVSEQDIKTANEVLIREGAADHQQGELLRGVTKRGYDEEQGIALVTDIVVNRELDEIRAQAGDLAVGLAAGRLHQEFSDGVHHG